MTVLEYFDYEKQLMADLSAVKTQCAKDAVYGSILRVLDDHKKFVTETMSKFEEKIQEGKADLTKVYRGETPDYVKKLMAEFGFHELEETDSGICVEEYCPSHMKKDISHKIKSLCKDETDNDAGTVADVFSEVNEHKELEQCADDDSADKSLKKTSVRRQKRSKKNSKEKTA